MVTELMKGIYRIEVPLPKNPLQLLNAYFISGSRSNNTTSQAGSRNLLIDTGFNRPECREALFAGLQELGTNIDETDIFLTHLHADHSGQIFSLKTPHNKVYAEEHEAAVINRLHDDSYWTSIYDEFFKEGLKMDHDQAISTHPGYMWKPNDTVDFDIVQDGQIIEVGDYKLRCIVTPGHSPGHTCLYDDEKKILFAGDMILGDITPNLCYELYLDDPLGQYLKSLDRVEALDIGSIFVGHRNMLQDPYGRIASLRHHHTLRCQEALDVLKRRGAMDAWDAAAHMSWDIDAKNWDGFPPSQKWFATGEAHAHLVFLYNHGLVSMREDSEGRRIYEYKSPWKDGLI